MFVEFSDLVHKNAHFVCSLSGSEEANAYYGALCFFALMDYLVEFTGECIINHCYADLSL